MLIKLSTWPCLEFPRKGRTIQILGITLINQIPFRKKLKADWSQEMSAIIWSGIFCVPVKNLMTKMHRTIILPVVLYGCETWSLILREEHRLRVLRRIFGPKRDEVTREWRKLHNEELNDLYSSPNIVWGGGVKLGRIRWAGHLSCTGRGEAYTGFWWGNLRERVDLGDNIKDNIKMDLQEVGCGGMDWIELAQERDWWRPLVNVIQNLRVP